ncbi:phosphoesterase [Gorgonomyces haynaldii]|nr:phosphoesterase [Gorgonomyces haynaldii]
MEDAYLGRKLRSKGRLLTNYHANFHPSQPNYIAMIAGEPFDCVSSDLFYNFNDVTIVDLLALKGKTWKTYQQDMPKSKTVFLQDRYPYCRKHNPFVSFPRIVNQYFNCIVNADELDKDALKGLPDYIFYTPNLINDGHDAPVRTMSNWLESFLEPKLVDPNYKDVLFLVTFDENDEFDDYDNNRIYSLLIGPGIDPGSEDGTFYTHYSQLAFLQREWGLPSLGKGDKDANAYKNCTH